MCGVKQISVANPWLGLCKSMCSATKTLLAELQEIVNSESGWRGALARALAMVQSIVHATLQRKELKMGCFAMVLPQRLLLATQPKGNSLHKVADLRA